MMKTILAPIDFSPVAENAATYAAKIAEFYGATLWLYNTYEMPVPLPQYSFPLVSTNDLQSAAEFEMEAFKGRIESKLRRKLDIQVRTECAPLLEGMEDLCNTLKPDMIVMGLSGKSALTRLVVGSNTIRTIDRINYPVLVVPAQAEFLPIRKIGFACDYKKVVESTPIEPLKDLLRNFNAELHVMNVDISFSGEPTSEVVEQSGLLQEMLLEFKPDFHRITAPDVPTGINWFAEQSKVDLMVVIPKKHNLMDKLFKRSQTKDLLVHTSVPVLCMHE